MKYLFNISKTIRISASHSLKGHVKCSRMHGHNYKIIVTLGSTTLPDNGMLIDFGDLNKQLKDLFEIYDHKHLGRVPDGWKPNPEHVVNLPIENTTTENLAKYWGQEIKDRFPSLSLLKIEVYESLENVASWIP